MNGDGETKTKNRKNEEQRREKISRVTQDIIMS